MADIRQVTNNFAVAPQIDEDDFKEIAKAGYKLVVNNRPDGETFGQMTSAEAEAAARENGMDYRSIPFAGPPSMAEVEALAEVISSQNEPIFAYCRSGTRSCTLWTLASVKAGKETPESALTKARDAGYDLSHLMPLLTAM